jgi:murein DD-endopeptidase MepM/ murein hydrolase activator NlpD
MKDTLKKEALSNHPFRMLALLLVLLVLKLPLAQSSAAESSHPSVWDLGVIPQNGSLHKSLAEKGMSSQRNQMIISLLSPHIDMKRIRPDTAFRFSLDQDGHLQEFLIELEGTTMCRLSKDPSGRYTVSKRPWRRRLEASRVSGEVFTTLEDGLKQAGEANDLAILFRKILAAYVEECPGIESGDRFTVVVDKIYAEETLLSYGEIQAFVIRKGETLIQGFCHDGSYYDEKGNSLRQHFLRVPLDYQFVSSEFMKSRRHPILGGVRPHRGIDLAAPYGTPVWAVADGEVVSCGWRGGYGNTVVLRHMDGYETLYGHLRRYGQGIREGARVKQKQIIGYIGSTGLSTGPHLHYGLTRNGKDCNPFLENFPRKRITGNDKKVFLENKKRMLAMLGEDPSFPMAQQREEGFRYSNFKFDD